MDLEWNGPVVLGEEGLPSGPGVYKVAAFDETKGAYFMFPRLLDNDDGGILCIGKARVLPTRLDQFLRSFDQRGTGKRYCLHSEANLLRMLHSFTAFAEVFRKCKLHVFYCILTDGRTLHEQECHAFREYVERFGEVPPVNASFPGRYTTWPASDEAKR